MKKKLKFTSALMALFLFLFGAGTALAEPSAEPTATAIADKLILKLGPEWAGTEFELQTDMGKYPGTIVVSDAGVLTTELGGSNIYTLTCLNPPTSRSAAGHDGDALPEPANPLSQDNEEQPPVNNTMPDRNGELYEAIPAPSEKPAETSTQSEGIPTLHLVLFIGGLVACGGGLILLQVMKRRREAWDDDED